MFKRLESLLASGGGRIQNLDDALDSEVGGIELHYGGRDGTTNDKIVVREHSTGNSGRVLVSIQFEPVNDEWTIFDSNKSELCRVQGEENYRDLASELEQILLR